MKIPFLHTHKKWVFAVVLIIFIMQACFLPFRAEDRFASSLYVALSHSFAFTYFFFFVTLFKDILAFFIRLWAKNAKGVKFDEKRRASIKFLFNLSLIIFGLGLILRGWGNANFIPNVRKIELKIKNLKQNLRIAMISDVHLGKNLHEGFLAKLVDKINALEPDLVVIVGDFIDTKPQDVAPYISKINELKSKFGTFYSLGNHEYYRGLDEILKLLKEKTNLKILINESVDIGVLNIAGLADLAGLRFENLNDEKNGVGLSGLGLNGELNFIPDIEKATANLSEDKPSILLSHQPKSVNLYDVSKFDLVLSGHTHAGQVFPFGILVYLQQGFLHGLYTLSEKTKLYVSSGAGFWGPAIRFLAPSEIALLELQGE